MGQPIAQQSDGLKNVDSGGRQLICHFSTVIPAYITVIPAQAGIPKGPISNRPSRVSGNPKTPDRQPAGLWQYRPGFPLTRESRKARLETVIPA